MTTLVKATNTEFLASWSLLTADNISKHLQEIIVAHKGHLRSTTMKHNEDQFAITQDNKIYQRYGVLIDSKYLEDVGYSDLAGPFHYTASQGQCYIFLLECCILQYSVEHMY